MFIPHIWYLKDKCMKAIDLLWVVSHTDWGADTAMLLKLSVKYQVKTRLQLHNV